MIYFLQKNNFYNFLKIFILSTVVIFPLNIHGTNPVFNAPNIRTVQLHKTGWSQSKPIIQLYSPEKLTLSFDDFSEDIKDYQYSIIHCSSDWETTDLIQTEYIDGFMPNPLLEYDYSFNTTFEYIHYKLEFPNEDIRLKLSGNYIIQVFELGNEEKPVLTRPFFVSEGKVKVIPEIRYTVNSALRESMQEVNFSILHPNLKLTNPNEEIKVVIQQNGRWDNQIKDLKPLFIRDNELSYDYNYENLFDGGNEFRWLDLRSTKYAAQHVQSISFFAPHYHFTLYPDKAYEKSYFYHEDFNGNYVIDVMENRDPEIEADYVYVHFTLPNAQPYKNGDLYITGALSDWQLNDRNKMEYDEASRSYQLTMLLKQGFYNYQYHYLENGTQKAEVSEYEGNFGQTDNDYVIYVYLRSPSDFYDRLVGVNLSNSLKSTPPVSR